nr:MAG TPA: hypothetical protein [Caudoviricetes sp.]
MARLYFQKKVKSKGGPHKGTASFSDVSKHMPACKFCNQNLFCYVLIVSKVVI